MKFEVVFLKFCKKSVPKNNINSSKISHRFYVSWKHIFVKMGKVFFKRVRMSHNRSKSINVPLTGQLFEVEYVEHVHVKKYCDDIFRWDWTEHTYLSSYTSKQLFWKVKYMPGLRNHWSYQVINDQYQYLS